MEREDILTTYHRKHVNVDIFYGNVFDQILVFIDRFNMEQVRNLQFYGPQAVDMVNIVKLLSKMPMLERLEFSPFTVSFEGDPKLCDLILTNLKRIKIGSVNCAALKFIAAKQINEVAVNGYRIPCNDDITC